MADPNVLPFCLHSLIDRRGFVKPDILQSVPLTNGITMYGATQFQTHMVSLNSYYTLKHTALFRQNGYVPCWLSDTGLAVIYTVDWHQETLGRPETNGI